jgi:competence protein ComEC
MGICCAYNLQNPLLITLLLILSLVLLIYSIVINIFYKTLRAYTFKGVTGIIFYLFCGTLGGILCLLNTQSLDKEYHANRSFDYLKVWVNDDPQQSNDIVRFEVVVTTGYESKKSQPLSGKLLIALKVDSLNPVKLKYGDELIISSKNLPVEPSYNPSEFDFKAWLATKNIYHQTFISQDHLIKLNSNTGNKVIKYAIEVRKRQVEIYRKLIHNDEAFAVASTLVLGYRADLSKETLATYSKTGTIHALSVSGMHVGIIYIFLNWALYFLDKKRALKIFKLLLISSLIWYYSLLTGFSPSVLRSAIMLTVYILAKAFNKNSNSYNILAFTAFCLLVYNPFLIWDVGFQLSFLAVFGLIYLQPKIYKWFYIKNKWLDKLWATVALSLAAQIATFPLSIYYFHQFPLYFIFSNLFILIPLTAMMYLGIGILMLRLYLLAPIFEWIINFTNAGLKWIADLPFSGITSIWLNQLQLILLSFTLTIFIIALINYKKKLLIASILCIFVFQSFTAYYKISASQQKKIMFFSLRKNYAAAFIDGNEAILLTDLSANNKNYEFFVKPALDQMQITKLHFVKWERDTVLKSFTKKEHQLVFHQYHILLIDDDFNYKRIDQLPKFESVWLHHNPRKNIADLRSEVLFSTLLVDATNKDYMIKRYEQDANKFELQSHILKKNNSYLIDLKVLK